MVNDFIQTVKEKIDTNPFSIVISVLLFLLNVIFFGYFAQLINAEHPMRLYAKFITVYALLAISIVFAHEKLKFFNLYNTNIFLLNSILFAKILADKQIGYDGFSYTYIFFGCLINIILLVASLGKLGNFISKILLAVAYLLILFYWGYYFVSGGFISHLTLVAIMQTTFLEATEYLRDRFTFSSIVLVGICLGFYYFQSRFICLLNNKNKVSKVRYLVIFVLIFTNIFVIYKYRKFNYFYVTLNGVNTYKNDILKFEQGIQKRRIIVKEKVESGDINKNIFGGVYFLVLGESQNRNHMNAFGYERPNTPWLTEKAKAEDTLLFNNAFACHANTALTLSYALTQKNQYNDLQFSNALSIIEIAKASGYETAWISNQPKVSGYDMPYTILANEADQQVWLNQGIGGTFEDTPYDLELVKSFDKITFSKNMLVVVHLMGCHNRYRNRYPNDFAKYDANDWVNNYDNAILYNDFVMKNLYDAAKQINGFKGLIYISDHAEDVKNKRMHDPSNFSNEMVTIPMYMVFDKSYQTNHAEKFNRLKESSNYVFTNDLLYDTVCGIMGIDSGEKSNDLSDDSYKYDKERFKTAYGKYSVANLLMQ